MSRNVMVTGGVGFIGSHVVNYFSKKYPQDWFLVVDCLTYASNLDNVKARINVTLEEVDIRDADKIEDLFMRHGITQVIHLAAESHVDNSIEDPNIFAETNIIGTLNLLNAAKKCWENSKRSDNVFYHVSTDEVYGTLELDSDTFTENTCYAPHSPYSASKASSDHFVRAYHDTYGLPILISNCSNNYGPHQHVEKLIPKAITNLMNDKDIPIYGTGENIRDWLYVGDHVSAIDFILNNGTIGETYNIGGDDELTNLELITRLCIIYADLVGGRLPDSVSIPIEFVEDRKGHDLRYGINSTKLKNLGWKPEMDFEKGMKETINYYINNVEVTS